MSVAGSGTDVFLKAWLSDSKAKFVLLKTTRSNTAPSPKKKFTNRLELYDV